MSLETLEERTVLHGGSDLGATILDAPTEGPSQDFYLPPQHRLNNLSTFLTGPSDGDALQIAMDFLHAHAQDLGLNPTDLADAKLTDRYTDESSGITHLYLRQVYDGLEVTNADLSVNISARGEVINVASDFVGAPQIVGGAKPQSIITASQAFSAFNVEIGLGVPSSPQVVRIDSQSSGLATVVSAGDTGWEDVPAHLVYVPTAEGLELAWRLDVHTADYGYWYDAFVNAGTGEPLYTDDRVGHAQYKVFALPTESPNDGVRTLVVDPADTTASPFGWHDTNGAPGAEFTDTRGNNVSAQEDVNHDDVGGFRPSGGANLTFDFPLDTTQNPALYQSASITNAFYWVNLLHDIHYQYGFTEAAGNFQVNNYGRGGVGNDPVIVDVQDGDGGSDSFVAFPDGQSPRMTLYTRTSPFRDRVFDSDILIHEFGHGISERLTGGPGNTSALNAKQSKGMGEGWGDWWALMLTQVSSDAKLDAYPLGNFAAGFAPNGPGIRRHPYSFDMAINPVTYSWFNGGAVNNEEHKAGEIWCSALWDMNWLLIEKYGFSADMHHGTGGNNLALQLVMDGLKLQGTNPSFLAGRDAILAADLARTGGQNQAEIWTAFARRGMGYSANDGGGAAATTVTEAFDVPGSIRGTVFRDDDANGVQNGAEPGLPGRSVYLDLNNNGVQDVPLSITYNSTDTPKPISDPGTTFSSLVVSGLSGTIQDINVTVNVTHPTDSQLYLTLISPANTPVIMANYLGGSGANYTNTTFDDEAATYIYTASAPFTGSFKPFYDFAQLDGRDPNGTWKLRMDDAVAGGAGTLLSWSLQISYGDPDPTTVTDANGAYSFYGLGDGTHHVREVAQPGFTQTAPASGVHNVVISGGQPVLGQNFGDRAAAIVADATTLEDTLSTPIVMTPPAIPGLTHFRISGITAGMLFKSNGTTQINNGDFITIAEGLAGVRFLPAAQSDMTGHFDVELSQDGLTVLTGTTKVASTINITPVGDTPQPGDITTLEDTLSGGIVINRNPNDGPEVTHFKISGILGGTLFKNDGLTPIHDGDFLTFGEGQLGVKFLPLGNSTTAGHFDVESSQDGSSVAAQSGKATSTINITPVNDIPVIVSNQTFSLAENLAIGTSVGILLATDPDIPTTLQNWTITGGNTNGAFAINPSNGTLTVANSTVLDREARSGFTLQVTVSDGISTSSAQNITINLNDVNDVTPVVTANQSFTLNENSDNTALLGPNLTATDGDVTTTSFSNWTITGGNTGGAFAINATTGQITVANSTMLDREAVAGFTLQVTVSDGTHTSAAQNVTINLSDVNDVTPVVTANQTFTLPENTDNGSLVGTANATDDDVTPTTFSNWIITSGNTNGAFAINATTGQLRVANSTMLDREARANVTLQVTVSDGVRASAAQNITVNLTDVNDVTPIVTANQTFTLPENTGNDIVVGMANATDSDVTPTSFSNWTITSGNTNGAFAINATTGQITVANGTALDREATSGFTLRVTVSDGVNTSALQNVTINLTDVNDITPVVSANQSLSIVNTSANGTAVGTLLATDGDVTPTTFSNWTLTGGNTGGAFSLNPGTGQLTVANNAALSGTFTLQATVSDGVQTSSVQNVTVVTFSPGNVAPVLVTGNLTFSYGVTTNHATLSASDSDPLMYSAAIGSVGHYLQSTFNLTYDPARFNYGGQQDKWFFAPSGNPNDPIRYFILPNGDFYQWNRATNRAQGTLITTVSTVYYAAPTRIGTEPAGSGPITFSVNGPQLTFDNPTHFEGQFRVTATVSDGVLPVTKSFFVNFTNLAPTLSPIANQTMPPSQDTLTVPLAALDLESDAITLNATVQSQAQFLDAKHNFTAAAGPNNGSVRLGEHWVTSGGTQWYYILPNGDLFQWDGTPYITQGTFIANVGVNIYATPNLLVNPSTAASVSLNGNNLTVDPVLGFVGNLFVTAKATDARGNASTQSFSITVAPAPTLTQPTDRSVAGTAPIPITLSAVDPSGLPITYRVSNEADIWQKTYGFSATNAVPASIAGAKWMVGAGSGVYYYLLANGELHRYDQRAAGQKDFLVRTLDTRYYANPTLLTNSPSTQATIGFVGNVMMVTPRAGFTGKLVLTLYADNGAFADAKTFTITVS